MATNIRKIGKDTEVDRILYRDFVSFARTGYVEVGEDNFCLPIYYEQYEERIRKFEVRDDDVFLAAHPKTGTTWAHEMIWLIVNNLDYEGAKVEMRKRCKQLELAALFDFDTVIATYKNTFDEFKNLFKDLEEFESPRCIKTHLHWSLLPEQIRNGSKNPKIISVLRNAEDVCVSYYHYCKAIEGYQGTFEDFCELFLAGRVPFGPFWKQVLSFWQQRDRPNILFIKYKDMKEDFPSVLKKVSAFLGKTITQEQVEKLAEHLSFDSMKNNPAVNKEETYNKLKKIETPASDAKFIRSGKVGSYKSVMSPELIKRFETWTRENIEGTGLNVE